MSPVLKKLINSNGQASFWNYFDVFSKTCSVQNRCTFESIRKLLKVGGIVIPVEVFNYIDQGQNPSLYTKNTLERALAKNEQVKGKIEVYSQFRQGQC